MPDLSDKPTQRKEKNNFLLIATIIILIGAAAARLIPGPRTIDDAYITFRYARSILAGTGFTFNPGEHVLGTTTPLFTLLMAGLGGLTGGVIAPFPWLALLVSTLADMGTCWLLVHIGRKLFAPYAGMAAAAAWAVAPYSVTFAIGGMETSLYIFLLTAAVAASLDRNWKLAALAAALAFLTRPDALIMIGLLAVDRAWRAWKEPNQRVTWQEAAWFILPVSAWVIFAWLYFGSPIPHSVLAKSLAYRLDPLSALIRLLQHYATPFLENESFGTPAIGVGIVLYPFLAAVGGLRAWKADRHAWVTALFPWFYLIVFAVPNPLIFRWYLATPLPFYFLTICMGAESILNQLITRIKLVQARLPIGSAAIFLIVVQLIFALHAWTLHPDQGPDRPAPQMAYIGLELVYQQAAESLLPILKSGEIIAAGDVGVLGFSTGTRILDTVGLNSPVSTEFYPLPAGDYSINYAIPSALIAQQKPDYLVFLEVYGRETLLKDAWFSQNYKLIEKIPTDIYGSDGMLIYRKAKD
jgi:Gpi18-like mannosyltransferase